MTEHISFVPSVKCPHCGKKQHTEISGWGRSGLNTRAKTCHYCNKDYHLIVYIESCVDSVPDGHIASIKHKIIYLKQRVHEKLHKLTNIEAEWAEEYLRTEASTGGRQN